MRVMIISYMGEDPAVQERRVREHDIQLKWLSQVLPKSPVHILAQRYKEEWFRKGPVYKVRSKSSPLLLPGFARNELLKEFYRSSDEWGLLLDNDAMLYQHQDGPTIFAHMQKFSARWSGVDIWVPLDPRNEPFSKRLTDPLYRKNIELRKCGLSIKGSMYVLRRPVSKDKIFFQETLDKGFAGEDGMFVADAVIAGWACYVCTTVVLREVVSGKYTTIKTLEESRRSGGKEMMELSRKMFLGRYGQHGLILQSGKGGRTRFSTKHFFRRYWRHPDRVLISKRG